MFPLQIFSRAILTVCCLFVALVLVKMVKSVQFCHGPGPSPRYPWVSWALGYETLTYRISPKTNFSYVWIPVNSKWQNDCCPWWKKYAKIYVNNTFPRCIKLSSKNEWYDFECTYYTSHTHSLSLSLTHTRAHTHTYAHIHTHTNMCASKYLI